MINQLNLIHSTHDDRVSPLTSGFTEWKTCLRSLYFGPYSEQVTHSGAEAYKLILQIICGLHSPMIGETEILSQFKKFIKENENVIPSKISQRLIQDAKKMRTKYLKNYGPQTYGSYTLKESQTFKKIIFYGAGSLVQDILPIIKNFSGEIIIKSRDPLKNVFIKKKYPNCSLTHIDESTSYTDALVVIAAPIASEDLESYLNSNFLNCSVLDMRSTLDGPSLNLKKDLKYKNLKNIFSELEKTQTTLKIATFKIREEINELADSWNKKLLIRPFGWEDLCS